jgi:hypothetical protein
MYMSDSNQCVDREVVFPGGVKRQLANTSSDLLQVARRQSEVHAAVVIMTAASACRRSGRGTKVAFDSVKIEPTVTVAVLVCTGLGNR